MKIVIFAGGVGSRLWPLSRKNSPKQFEKIIGNESTLQLAALRLQPDFPWEDLYVSTGKKYINIVREQLPNLPESHVIGEPEMRDVGPAVALITAIFSKQSPQEPMGIIWSDHLVGEEKHFRKILKAAGEIIADDPNRLVFVAQKPRFASENLGWINFGEVVTQKNNIKLHEFKAFKYKPDSKTAKEYMQSGHHGWNLGYFVTSPQFLLNQFKIYAPEVYSTIMSIVDKWGTSEFYEVLSKVYPTIEKIHFDNAILEKLNPSDALVICEDIKWSDIGAWEALKEALASAESENVTKGNVLVQDCQDSLLFNFTTQLAVGIDLNDMLVINTGDVLLVCPKSSVPKIKKLVENMAGTDHEHLT